MNGQNAQQNNNNRRNNRRFNNPFNLDPTKEDICIERKLDKDIFCPLTSLAPNFGEENEYYSMIHVNPLKESFYHAMEALFFPNATFFQFSSILCYINILTFLVVLCFGLDETNYNVFLQVKLSTVDKIGSFYPKKMKKNFLEYYRLLTFHFLHFNFTHLFINIISLISFCSFFELLIKKYIFILILFLSGIFSTLTSMSFFNENERYCGMNADIYGIFGAFIMFFIQNWEESNKIFIGPGRFISIYLLCVYIFFILVLSYSTMLGNVSVQFISLFYGAFIFAILTKPIKVNRRKTIIRIGSAIALLTFTLISIISFYEKEY